MAYKDPEKAKERYRRYREKMKALHPEIYKDRLAKEHARAYAKLKLDPERLAKTNAKKSAAAKARWADPEYRARHAVAQREYLANPDNLNRHNELVGGYARQNKVDNRLRFAKYKELGCAICPERCDVVLDAHRFNPETKEFGIGKALGNYCIPRKFVAELAKCTCLCSNCHRKVHAGLLQCPVPIFNGTIDPLTGVSFPIDNPIVTPTVEP